MEGESDAELMALPAAFSFTMDEFKKKMAKEGERSSPSFPARSAAGPVVSSW